MAIQRQTDAGPTKTTFRVNINITLTKGGKLTEAEQNKLMEGLDGARIIIIDPDANIVINPGSKMLVDEVVPAKEFKSGNVGFGLQAVGVEFA